LHSKPTNLLQSPTTFPPRITVHTDTSTTFATSADFVVNDSTTDDSDHLNPQHNEITSNDHASDDRHNDDCAINDGDINNKDNGDTAGRRDNDRTNDQRTNDDSAHSIGVSTTSTNEKQLASLPAAPNAVDSDAPAHDDNPGTIETFLLELDNLRNELLQLTNSSSASPSDNPTTKTAPVNDDHNSTHNNNDEHDTCARDDTNCNHNNHANSERKIIKGDNDTRSTNECYQNDRENKNCDANDCGHNDHENDKCRTADCTHDDPNTAVNDKNKQTNNDCSTNACDRIDSNNNKNDANNRGIIATENDNHGTANRDNDGPAATGNDNDESANNHQDDYERGNSPTDNKSSNGARDTNDWTVSTIPAQIVTSQLATTKVFHDTPPAPSIGPPTTDPLDATITRLNDRIDLLMEQCRQYQEMMAQTNAQILTGLQQVVELLPKFLASLSQQTNVPFSPQIHNSLPHPESDQRKLPPWKTAKNSFSLMPKQAANKAMNLVLKVNQLHYQKHINYQTSDLFSLPLKHVCFKTFKTSALGNRGPTMLWPKEDMRPP